MPSSPSPANAEAHLKLADILFSGNENAEAIAEYEKVLALKPQSTKVLTAALNRLGYALALEGRFTEAVPYIRKALSIWPGDPGYLASLGFALAGQEQYEEAIANYEAAVKMLPNIPTIHLYFAQALEKAGKKNEAQKEFNLACQAQAQPANTPSAAATGH